MSRGLCDVYKSQDISISVSVSISISSVPMHVCMDLGLKSQKSIEDSERNWISEETKCIYKKEDYGSGKLTLVISRG